MNLHSCILRNHFQGVALNGKILAPGGQFGHDGGHTDLSILTIYDPDTNSWSEAASLPGNRSHAEAGTIVMNERLVVVGGRYNQGPYYNTIIEYNPQADSWRTMATLPFYWYAPFVAYVDGKIIVTAGGTHWSVPQQNTWIADVTFDCPNEAPVAINESYLTNENVTLTIPSNGVLDNDSDADGDSLTAILDSTTSNGNLTLSSDGSFTYLPNLGFIGTDTFTYHANDGSADSNIATVSIQVLGVGTNTPPIASGDTYTTNENVTLTIPANGVLSNDSDADGDSLTAILDSTTSNGTLTLNNNGSFSYVPTSGFFGTDSFRYYANDGSADSNRVTVTITINEVNNPPVAVADSYATDEDIPLTIPANGVLDNDSDADGDSFSVILSSNATNGTVSLASNGSFTYTPNTNFNGTDSFTYIANDGDLDSSATTVRVTVNPINDPPIARNDTFANNENTVLSVPPAELGGNDSDIDGDALTYFLDSDVSSGTLVFNADGSFIYEPNQYFFGSDTFTYYINDGVLNSPIATVTIVVDNTNDPPISTSDAYEMDENTTLTIPVSGILDNDSDYDGSPLQSILDSDVLHGTLVLQPDGSFEYTPEPNYEGTDTFTYIADDGVLQSGVSVVTIVVKRVNVMPIASDDEFRVRWNSILDIDTGEIFENDFDAGDDTLTASIFSQPSKGTVTLNSNGHFRYQPEWGFRGLDEFVYEVNDGYGGTATATVSVMVVIQLDNHDDDNDNDDDDQEINFSISDTVDSILDFVLNPDIQVFDPAISKIGFLLPGQLGVNGEQLEWVVTVRNNGNAPGQNVLVEDVLRDELRIDRVDTPKGTVSIVGQRVQVLFDKLNPGESVQFSIFTTVISGGATVENEACVSASNTTFERCVESSAIGTLPLTGDKSEDFPLLPMMMLWLSALLPVGFLWRLHTR